MAPDGGWENANNNKNGFFEAATCSGESRSNLVLGGMPMSF